MRIFLNHIKVQLKEENHLIYNIDRWCTYLKFHFLYLGEKTWFNISIKEIKNNLSKFEIT